MSQIVMTQAERIAGLRRLGYGESEAGFLCLAALHGGYFLRRQYAEFLGREDGGTVTQLMQKVLDQGHARASTWRQNTQLYHLCSRRFYAALGQENNRNRRRRQLPNVKNKVMGLDFVLAHPKPHYLATEQEKLHYFTGTLQLETAVLPTKRYLNNGHATDRHFVEKYPIFLADSAQPAASPVVNFCFVDEGASGLSGFWTFLVHYRDLFACLREFQVIYVAAASNHFQAAAKAYARFANREIKTNGANGICPTTRMVAFFEARQLYETQQWNSFDRAKLLRFRDDRREFSGPEIERLYQRWKAKGRDEMLEILDSKESLHAPVHGKFSTYLLEHNYGLFDSFALV
jgi:hypothetical protein